MLQKIIDFLTSPFVLWGISFSLLDVFFKLLLPIIIGIIFYRLILFLVKRLILKPLKIKDNIGHKILTFIKLFLRIVFSTGFLILLLNFFGPDIVQFFNGLWKILSKPFFTAGSSQISFITIILTIPVFYFGTWISRITKRFVESTMLSRISMEEETKFTISILLRNGIMILAILVGLSMIGIDLSSLAIIFGVLGIGLGFGLQGMVANFVAGLVLIFERPIKEGDRIKVCGMEGDVLHIRFRSTVINTLTNETIIVPNSKLVDDNIHNYSYFNPRIIVVNKVQVSYNTDLIKLREILIKLNENNPYALSLPAPEVRVLDFQDSGILVELRTWIKKAKLKYQAKSWINYEIWQKLKESGIIIPYPQMDLHIKEIPTGHNKAYEPV